MSVTLVSIYVFSHYIATNTFPTQSSFKSSLTYPPYSRAHLTRIKIGSGSENICEQNLTPPLV